MKKIVLIIFAILLPSLIFASNNSEKKQSVAKSKDQLWDYKLPLVEKETTITYYTTLSEIGRQYMKTLDENYMIKEIEKQTGLNIDFVHPPAGDNGEYFNIVLASGDYPDVIKDPFSRYPGGPDGAINDGVLIDMGPYIEKYTPTFMKMVKEYGLEKKIRSDKGTIIKFGTIFMPPFLAGKTGRGLIIRKDLLEKFSLKSPKTLDEFTNVLRVFKQNGIEIPLVISNYRDWMWNDTNIIASAFGTTHKDYYVNDGKVNYGPIEPEYKEYLSYLKMLFEEGLLDPDFMTHQRGDSMKIFQSGKAGVFHAGIWELRKILEIGAGADPDFDIEAVPFFTKDGSPCTLQNTIEHLSGTPVFVSSNAKDPVLIAKYFEYLHQKDTMQLVSWGPGTKESPTYEIVDGKLKFTDFMQNGKNPFKADFPSMRVMYTDANMTVAYDNEMEKQQYDDERVLKVFDGWSDSSGSESKYPLFVTPTVEESKELVNIEADIKTYVEEMFHKFVMGSVSLDDFDDYVKSIKNMGIDRAIELKQAGLNRYLAR